MSELKHIVVTGGAGFVGSFLTGDLLRRDYLVTVVDELLYGGESLLAYRSHPGFNFVKADVWEPHSIKNAIRSNWPNPHAVIHLAGLVGFPACQAVGRQVAWRYNVETTQHAFEQATEINAKRFVYVSTYNIYGLPENNRPITENAPLNPQSLYGETKSASERYLLGDPNGICAPVIFRTAHMFGLSPRPRFDIIVNQFVLDAFLRRELLIYQRGYLRSFIHIADAVKGIILGLEAPEEKVRGQVFNLGNEINNLTKDEVVTLILKRLPETQVVYKDLTFGGDMRDLLVSFQKIRQVLNFKTMFTVDDGIREILDALRFRIIKNPQDSHYRNAQFIVR